MSTSETRRALECDECSSVTPDEHATSYDECPVCGSDATTAVTVTGCADEDCQHDDHHFGLSAHVTPIDG